MFISLSTFLSPYPPSSQVFAALLQNQKASRCFAEVLASFLVTQQLDALKLPDSPRSKLTLQLFRLLFGSVAKYPADCERVLLPHLTPLVEAAIKGASDTDKPLAYLQLLRMLFRALAGGGKFDLLFREFVTHILPCLNLFLGLLEGPAGSTRGDLLVELCLSLPARLSSLLSHLPRLMQPLVLALKSPSLELVGLGLRTFELWVDAVSPEYLDPATAPVQSELLMGLWSHLRPKPYPYGPKALQLLGKLGGRSSRFLRDPLPLDAKANAEHGFRVVFTFEGSSSFLVPLDRCIAAAHGVLTAPQAVRRGLGRGLGASVGPRGWGPAGWSQRCDQFSSV